MRPFATFGVSTRPAPPPPPARARRAALPASPSACPERRPPRNPPRPAPSAAAVAPLALRAVSTRALLVRADLAALDEALRPLVDGPVRAAVVERVLTAGLADTRPHRTALVTELGTDVEGWLALEVHVEGGSALPLWPLAAAPADVVAWLMERAPDRTAASACCEQIRGFFAAGGRAMGDDAPASTVHAKDTPTPLGLKLLAAGRIDDEQLRAALVQQSSEIVYELLRWTKGRFTFQRRAPDELAEKALAKAKKKK